MSEAICECGHPQKHHVFGKKHCTVSRRTPGSGYQACRCTKFELQKENMVESNLRETIAQEFHETYERLAPDFGYKTREASAVPWEKVPETNRGLMMAVVEDLLDRKIIHG